MARFSLASLLVKTSSLVPFPFFRAKVFGVVPSVVRIKLGFETCLLH